jgi:hypothetical protein
MFLSFSILEGRMHFACQEKNTFHKSPSQRPYGIVAPFFSLPLSPCLANVKNGSMRRPWLAPEKSKEQGKLDN